MAQQEPWIWLSEELYPEDQHTSFSAFGDKAQGRFAVAEFRREYAFEERVVSARLRFCGDTLFQLYLGGALLATGPACVGGDFIGNETARDAFFAYETEIHPDAKSLSFFARVRMMPVQICDYSRGHGGFLLTAELTLESGRRVHIGTDESWQARKNGAWAGPRRFDGRIPPDEWHGAQRIGDIWHARTAPIPVRTERELVLQGSQISLAPGEARQVTLELDRIYAGFVRLVAQTRGELCVKVHCRELTEQGSEEEAVFAGPAEYRGFVMHSAGNLLVEAENRSDALAAVQVSFIETLYPVAEEAHTTLSDPALTQVLETCAHTLKICRQTHHLDSPRHCEPMACTGDYYIQSLMTPFAFGDMRLAAFDVERTALMLERENGRMFHTTYSCIWARMLLDVYRITGDRALLARCEKALGLLIRRFESYLGENGLIETPPDYMFVDWIYIDGLSMHHPPKALGQTCLNMFFFGALQAASQVYGALNRPEEAARCHALSESLRGAVNAHLYDPERGMYFEGLNTPTPEELLGQWMPRNVEKRYYLKHSNVLAAYFGVCSDEIARTLVRKIMEEEIPGEVQPYFLHYLLEAVYRLGLRDVYTLRILERWKAPVQACPKGLVEGFVKPEPTYRFDHSHAWGGTPLYSLPRALLGLKILEPGMERIRLSPSLLGLSRAHVELLTPKGRLVCDMEAGRPPRITAPRLCLDLCADALAYRTSGGQASPGLMR